MHFDAISNCWLPQLFLLPNYIRKIMCSFSVIHTGLQFGRLADSFIFIVQTATLVLCELLCGTTDKFYVVIVNKQQCQRWSFEVLAPATHKGQIISSSCSSTVKPNRASVHFLSHVVL